MSPVLVSKVFFTSQTTTIEREEDKWFSKHVLQSMEQNRENEDVEVQKAGAKETRKTSKDHSMKKSLQVLHATFVNINLGLQSRFLCLKLLYFFWLLFLSSHVMFSPSISLPALPLLVFNQSSFPFRILSLSSSCKDTFPRNTTVSQTNIYVHRYF